MTDTETARILARFNAMQRDHCKAMQSLYGSISAERRARAAFKARWGITWTQASDLIHKMTCAPLEGDEDPAPHAHDDDRHGRQEDCPDCW